MSKIYSIVRSHAVASPDKIAIIGDGGEVFSYQQLLSAVDHRIQQLQEVVEPDSSRVALCLHEGEQIPVTVLALNYLGVPVIPLNPTLQPLQMVAFLDAVDATVVVLESATAAAFVGLDESIQQVTVEDPHFTVQQGGAGSVQGGREYQKDEAFLITLSSGSTGDPKPIILSEQNKLGRAKQAEQMYQVTAEDRVLCASPFFHSLGQRLTFMPLLKGGTLVLMDRFTPQRWVDLVAAQEVTFTICVSSHLYALREQLVSQGERLHSLRALVSSSAAIDKELKEYLFEQVGCAFYEIYGATEVAIVTNLEPKDVEHKSASVGKACEGVEVMILNDQHQPLPTGEVGEIACRSPLMFSGYLNQPELTEVTRHQGYFLTGDLGYQDEDTFLYFVSRKKDVIISGGSNIYPMDIEAVVLESASIAECAVVGINDSYLGEVVIAVCVWRQGEEQDEWQLRQWVNSQLSPFQRPLKYFFVEQLPLTSTGKINKRALREEHNRLGLDLSAKIRLMI